MSPIPPPSPFHAVAARSRSRPTPWWGATGECAGKWGFASLIASPGRPSGTVIPHVVDWSCFIAGVCTGVN
jgi:hypothetical protein